MLDARGVRVLTLSAETPAAIRKGRGKHGLRAEMWADPKGEAIAALGVQNQGVHSGLPGGPRLPIPTTVLVDAAGRVVWIDQSANHQRRSDPARVAAGLQTLGDG